MNAELDALKGALDRQREHVVGILEGLSAQDLRRPVLPSGWSCLALLRHLTLDVEHFWFPGVIAGEPDFAAERKRLSAVVERFATAGPSACTTHPHTFFGHLTADEWARLMYKHIDHHLKQFGV